MRAWYTKEHDNWSSIDGERSQWWVWERVHKKALHSAQQIQQYLARITEGERGEWVKIIHQLVEDKSNTSHIIAL